MKAWLPGVIVFALAALPVGAQTAAGSAPTHDQVSKVTELLFVQNARSGSFKDGRLTLEESGPVIFFSDRPYRVFGHTRAEHFVDSWDSGADSFAKNPPNAVLSLLGEDVESFGVVLSDPKYDNGTISYRVELEEGTIPTEFGPASMFIDNNLWAAVGGLAVGRTTARRQQYRTAAAYSAGQASATQDQNTYYQAAPSQAPAPAAAPASPPATTEQQLQQLKDLLDKGLISQDDYDKKKQQILQQL
ncbi:MAG: SHOCT domain-containing protein [Thermoanaerobaculia bacterium]